MKFKIGDRVLARANNNVFLGTISKVWPNNNGYSVEKEDDSWVWILDSKDVAVVPPNATKDQIKALRSLLL